MYLPNLLLALVASSTVVMAAPHKESSAGQNAANACPSQWKICGECNGTMCKIAGTDLVCRDGTSCTAQSGGGDGKICGLNNLATEDPECPGSK